MKLPDIGYNAPVQNEIAPALGRLGQATDNLSSTMQAGLQAYGQEVVRTKTIDAHNTVQAKRAQLDADLDPVRNPAIPPSALKARLGADAWDKLPDDVKADAEKTVPLLDANGQPTLDANGAPALQPRPIETYRVAHEIYAKEIGESVDAAAQGIPGEGWQNGFKRAVMTDSIRQWGSLNEKMLGAFHKDQVDTRGLQILTAAFRAKTPEEQANVYAIVSGSMALLGDDGVKREQRTIGGIFQKQPLDGALTAFRTDPSSEAARGGLKDQLRNLSNPEKTSLLTPDQVAHYARELRLASDKADKIQDGNALQNRARGEEARIWGETKADPVKALAAARALPDTRLSDAVVKRLGERDATDKAASAAADAPRVGALESKIAQGRGLDRYSPDYQLSSIISRARVDEKYNARVRSMKAEGSEERRQQSEADRTAIARFDGLDLKGTAGQDQVSSDTAAMFPGTSEPAAAMLLARQKKARDAWTKDQGVTRQQFTDKVTDAAEKLGYKRGTAQRPGDAEHFKTFMVNKLDEWENANPGKHSPPPEVVNKMFGDAVLYGNDNHWYASGKPAWKAERAGEEFHASPEQSAKVQNVRDSLDAAAPATPKPAAATPKGYGAAGTQLPSDQLGYAPGGVFEVQKNGKLKRVK